MLDMMVPKGAGVGKCRWMVDLELRIRRNFGHLRSGFRTRTISIYSQNGTAFNEFFTNSVVPISM